MSDTLLVRTTRPNDSRVALVGIVQGKPKRDTEHGMAVCHFRLNVNLREGVNGPNASAVVLRSEMWAVTVWGDLATHLCDSELGERVKLNVVGAMTDTQPHGGFADYELTATEVYVSLASHALKLLDDGKTETDWDFYG